MSPLLIWIASVFLAGLAESLPAERREELEHIVEGAVQINAENVLDYLDRPELIDLALRLRLLSAFKDLLPEEEILRIVDQTQALDLDRLGGPISASLIADQSERDLEDLRSVLGVLRSMARPGTGVAQAREMLASHEEAIGKALEECRLIAQTASVETEGSEDSEAWGRYQRSMEGALETLADRSVFGALGGRWARRSLSHVA